jgi:uncharacterized phiE125 gp8 family phage protein
MAVRWETKRPNEVRDYRHDWSAFLDGDTIASSDVTVSGITLDSDTNDDTSVTVWLSGGTEGTLARVSNTIVTAGGRTESENFIVYVSNFPEPVSLTTAKAHLRVLHDAEDSLICSYIRTAREWVEGYSGHILVRRAMTQEFNGFSSYLELFYRPVVDDPTVAYVDADGAPQELTEYAQTTGRYPYRIYPDEIPSIEDNSTVTVTYTAGYAEGEEPQRLVQAILVLVAGMHANRGTIPEETAKTAAWLCDQHRGVVL